MSFGQSLTDIEINLLPATRKLREMTKQFYKLQDTTEKLRGIKGVKFVNDNSSELIERAIQELTGKLNDIVARATDDLFRKIVARTPKLTGRAAGSWTIGWDKSDDADIGFLQPEMANKKIVFFSHPVSTEDWYPEAPILNYMHNGGSIKHLGVHDWSSISIRHNDLVNKVTREIDFYRVIRKTAKGRFGKTQTIFIYNNCPYINDLEAGSSPNASPGGIVAISVAGFEAYLSRSQLPYSANGYSSLIG